MAGMTMQAAKSVYEQTLKANILKTMQDAMTATFMGNETDIGKAVALKFATEVANGLAGPICETIVNIVSQAQVTGTVTGVVTGSCAAGPVAGANIDMFTGSELSLI
jgi:hypothetical protein